MTLSDDDAGWTPVLKGDIYCSPKCGCDCTKAAYDDALKRGDAMLAELGDGWECNIWENGGWHVEAHKGLCTIYDYTNLRMGNYMLMMNFPPITADAGSTPQLILHGADLTDLVGNARQDARTFIARIEQALAGIA